MPQRWTKTLSVLLACGLIAGCAALPQPEELRNSVVAYPGGPLPEALDGRARFREIFCGLKAASVETSRDAGSCDELLWRLTDEPVAPSQPAAIPQPSRGLRIFVVSGAFGDCRGLDTIPYATEIQQLAAQGVRIQSVLVSGRSSPDRNARQLAAVIEEAGIEPGDRLVLIGYSKGAVDILQFLIDFPGIARQVVGVVSVAGAIHGSPLATRADWWYRTFFAKSFGQTCDPGDGQVIASLVPATRQRWLDEHPLPAHVTYFSLAAFTTGEHLSHGLQATWRILAEDDRRNDGQLLIADAVIPGATLLGYVNADHWDIAIPIDRQMPHLAARRSPREFPRPVLLDAMLRYVTESLEPAVRPLL